MTTTESKPLAGGGSPDTAYEHHLTADEQKWIDKKKYAWIFSIVPAAIPLVIWGVAEWMKAIGAPEFFVHASWFLGPVAVFLLIPIGDFVLGRDGENAPEEFVPQLEETKYYRILAERLSARRLDLQVTDAAKGWLAERGYEPAYGARPLRRLIQKAIGDALAKKLLAGEVRDGDTVQVDVDPHIADGVDALSIEAVAHEA
ncbi:hypothetical protein KR044_006514 [Drosophila immigrans]|nr:hypothetical protein KR044_006514 [Drosophila immigrans]